MADSFAPIQSNYTAGEQDPQLISREDAAIYYSGAERARNVLLIPHGGFTRRPGLLYRDEALPVIEAIDLTGVVATTPNGGTAANAFDGDPATRLITATNISTTDPYVALRVDMGAGFTDLVRFADVEDISTGTELVVSGTVSFTAPSTITATGLLGNFTNGRKVRIKGSTDGLNDDVFTIASHAANTITTTEATLVTQGAGPTVSLIERADFLPLSGEFRIQASMDDAVWVDFGLTFPLVTDEDARWYYRRSATAPINYRYWRVVRIGTTDAADRKVELGEFRLWKDTATLSNSRQIEFEAAVDQTYSLLATANNLRVYKDGVRQADIFTPHTSAQLPSINWTQEGDTLVIFHNDVQTRLVRRLGSDTLWNAFPLPFTSIPTRTFGDTQAAGVEDEPVWSATRGWPRCGAFFKGRFYLAGTRDLTGTYWGSAVLDIFAFKPPAIQEVDDAFEFTIGGGGVSSIWHLESADLLFIITSSGPFTQVTPENALPDFSNVAVEQIRGRRRAKGPGLRAFQLDNAVVYLDDSGEQLNEIVEPDFQRSFQVNNLAFSAPHLVKNPVDLTVRPSLSTDRGDLILLVNTDGSLSVLQTLRSRDFSGWTGWHVAPGSGDTLQGRVKSVGTQIGGINGRYFVVVERVVNGVARQFYEEFLDNSLLDSSVTVTATSESFTATAGQTVFTYSFTSPAAEADLSVRSNLVRLNLTDDYTVDLGAKTVTLVNPAVALDAIRIAIKITSVSIPHLEGETVRVRADGALGASQIVAGGTITVAEFSDAQVQAGLDFPDIKEVLVDELQTKATEPLTEEEARFQVFGNSAGVGQGDGILVRDMPAAVPPDSGTTIRGKKKRVHTAVVTVSDTQGLYFGANGEPTEPLDFQEMGEFLLDRRPPLRSGPIRVYGLQGWTLEGQTEITQRDPVPMTVLSVVRKMKVAR